MKSHRYKMSTATRIFSNRYWIQKPCAPNPAPPPRPTAPRRSGRPGLVFLAGVLSLVFQAAAADPNVMMRLNEALRAAASFEYGQDSGPLDVIEQIVVETSKDSQLRAQVEQRLLTTLESKEATRPAKAFLCRQLRTMGTAQSVPQLEALLTDPDLSHMARFALGRIEGPAAPAALQRALRKTSGPLQVGILNTLGDLGYEPARMDITRWLRSPDPAVAQAAVRALGQIGGPDVVKVLQIIRPQVEASLGERIDDALLVCADRFLAEDKPPEAARIYKVFYAPDQPKHLRIAALRGLIAARSKNALALLSEAMRSPDPALQANAIDLVRTVPGQDTTKALADLLPSLAPEAQELLLIALSARNDSAALPAVTAATKSDQANVRVAALAALGRMGDASTVVLLAQTAATAEAAEQQEARASLRQLAGLDVDQALVRALPDADPKTQIELIRALAGRRAKNAGEPLFALTKNENKSVRQEATTALGALANESDLPALVALVASPQDPEDLPALEEAVARLFRRIEDPERRAEPVLAALPQASPEAKPTLLRLLSRAATPRALAAVRAGLKDPDQAVREAALRALSDWPDAAPAEDLLQITRSAAEPTQKVLALRGYVRLAGLTPNPADMYARAMALAERPDDKRLVLSGLGTASSAEALQLVEEHLADPDLQTEAGLAAVQIADRLRARDATCARAGLEKVVGAVQNAGVRQKAQDLLNELDQYEGYLLSWMVAGPYKEKGKESQAIFDAAFPPEKSGADAVEWKPLNRGVGSWDINLESMLGSHDHAAAYLRTRVWSPKSQAAHLELGSDDAIKAWLNGKLVHENYVHRGVSPRQDTAKVDLQEGWNDLLLKVVDHAGGWGVACRIRQLDGRALEGLKVEAK